nr:MAG TPA: hypothetical protein [Caudoviricetes sp.]
MSAKQTPLYIYIYITFPLRKKFRQSPLINFFFIPLTIFIIDFYQIFLRYEPLGK